MNVKNLKPYLNYVIDNIPGKKFEFSSKFGKIYHLLFYKLDELDPPFEFLCIKDINKSYRYFYKIHNNEIIWEDDRFISKQLKTHCNRIIQMFIFL
jgi:hypothetical protein